LIVSLYIEASGHHAAAASAKQAAADTYQTTAYYLNVRAEASAKTKILKVVKKGTILAILHKTDNGWLKLDGGGYVHGGYATPVTPESLDSKPAETTESSVTSAPNGPSEPAQPAKSAHATPRKPASAVQTASGLTAEHIAQIFKGTGLAGHGLEKAVVQLESDYGINAYFTIAVMKLESGDGKSRMAKNKNNLFGLNGKGGYLRFASKPESVRKFGQLISKNYIGKGYTTVEKVARKYCPVNPKWPALVKTIMNRDYKKAAFV
jgi:flagellum-specific peptidoglycan hydrolase FlgJ